MAQRIKAEVLNVNVSDSIHLSDELQLKKMSQDGRTVGLAYVNDQREISAERIDQDSTETLTVKHMTKRQRHEEQEIQVIQRLLPIYNAKNKTDYSDPIKNPEQSSPIDVICSSQSGSFPELNFQVTVSEREAFSEIGKSNSFSRSMTGADKFFVFWKERIQEKSGMYTNEDKRNIILALDGWPVAYEDDLNEFIKKEKALLQKSGFKEIWFIGWMPELIVQLH